MDNIIRPFPKGPVPDGSVFNDGIVAVSVMVAVRVTVTVELGVTVWVSVDVWEAGIEVGVGSKLPWLTDQLKVRMIRAMMASSSSISRRVRLIWIRDSFIIWLYGLIVACNLHPSIRPLCYKLTDLIGKIQGLISCIGSNG